MSDLITRFLQENRKQRVNIYCIGDSLVDEYWDCKVNRISPEFPVPVVHVKDRAPVFRPGGAANVAYQMNYFNVNPYLVSILNDRSLHVMEKHKINKNLSAVCTCDIPVKKRYLDNGIQVVRVDHEDSDFYMPKDYLHEVVEHLVYNIIENWPKDDVVIMSDYNKGLFYNPQMFLKYLNNTPTIVDPKKGPISKWKGCTIFKPNAAEAKTLSGLDDWKDQCKYFQRELDCKAVVITQSGSGVVGIDSDEFFEYHPSEKILVESVIGAGDCFVATLAMAIARKFSVAEASEIAFRAGSIYVQNRMNRPIVPAELSPVKYVIPEDLKDRDFKLVFTNGCFDFGLTAAHVEYLKEAKSYGNKLVVAVNSDDSVRRLKGEGRPIMNTEERMKILAALECVDFVTSFDEDTPLNIIKTIKPDIVCKGGDYKPEDVVGYGISEVKITSIYNSQSTTDKINKLK